MGSWIQRFGWLVRVIDLVSRYWTAIVSIGGAGVVGAFAYATDVFNDMRHFRGLRQAFWLFSCCLLL